MARTQGESPLRAMFQVGWRFGLALGLGLGLAMTFIREQMDRSFRDAEDLETALGQKVLASIPKIENGAIA